VQHHQPLARIFPAAPVVQQTDDVGVLMRHAEMARSKLRKFSVALAEEIGLNEDSVVPGPIKELGRIFDKASGRYDGDVRRICDICRQRILFDNPADVVAFRRLLSQGVHSKFYQEAMDHGVRIAEVEDCFAKPKKHGYIGINIQLEIDLGKGRTHVAELQLMHRDMVEADKTSHYLYDQIRLIDEQESFRTLTEDEKNARESYLKSNKALYEAESARLGLDVLRLQKEWQPSYGKPALSAA
jgi:hypothetical protein